MPMLHSFDMHTTTTSQSIGLEIYCYDGTYLGYLRVTCRIQSPINDDSYVSYVGVSLVLHKKKGMTERYDGAYFMVH